MSRRQEEYNPKKVFVGNLDPRTTKADLEEFLRPFGRFNVWIATSPPGFAFVHFEDERDASEAVRQMNGKDLLGRTLRVEISTGVSKRGRAHDQYTDRRSHRSPSPSNRRDKSPGRYHGMPAPMDSPYAYPYPPYGYPPHYPYPPSSYPPYGGGYPPAAFHGSDPRSYPDDRQRRRDSGLCFHCNKPGHFARQCPEKSDRDRERDRERNRDRDRRSRSRSRSRSRGDRRDRGDDRHHRHDESAPAASSAAHNGGHDPDGMNSNSTAAPIAANADSSLSASHAQAATDSFQQQHDADHSGYSAAHSQ